MRPLKVSLFIFRIYHLYCLVLIHQLLIPLCPPDSPTHQIPSKPDQAPGEGNCSWQNNSYGKYIARDFAAILAVITRIRNAVCIETSVL